jgi:hypothetical protein
MILRQGARRNLSYRVVEPHVAGNFLAVHRSISYVLSMPKAARLLTSLLL